MELNEEEALSVMNNSKRKDWEKDQVSIHFWTKKKWFTGDDRSKLVRILFEEGPEIYSFVMSLMTPKQLSELTKFLEARKQKELFEQWGD